MVWLTVRQCFTVPLCFSQACWDWNWSSVLCLHIVLGHMSWLNGRFVQGWPAGALRCMQQEQQKAGLGQAADCTQPHPLMKTLLHIYCLLSSTAYSRAVDSSLRAAPWLFCMLEFKFSVIQSLWWLAHEISLSCSHPSNKWCMNSSIQLACGRCEGRPQVLCRTRVLEWILAKTS